MTSKSKKRSLKFWITKWVNFQGNLKNISARCVHFYKNWQFISMKATVGKLLVHPTDLLSIGGGCPPIDHTPVENTAVKTAFTTTAIKTPAFLLIIICIKRIRNSCGLGGYKLSPCSGSIALRQVSPIHKKGSWSFQYCLILTFFKYISPSKYWKLRLTEGAALKYVLKFKIKSRNYLLSIYAQWMTFSFPVLIKKRYLHEIRAQLIEIYCNEQTCSERKT